MQYSCKNYMIIYNLQWKTLIEGSSYLKVRSTLLEVDLRFNVKNRFDGFAKNTMTVF